eukprot:GILJ01001264.1.p1 GENE.GILJ01001264.1~~GILJ01001264.1.p1  ORF type:complete len:312 (+),score=18.40 GILJ01001264.1:81-938(+)
MAVLENMDVYVLSSINFGFFGFVYLLLMLAALRMRGGSLLLFWQGLLAMLENGFLALGIVVGPGTLLFVLSYGRSFMASFHASITALFAFDMMSHMIMRHKPTWGKAFRVCNIVLILSSIAYNAVVFVNLYDVASNARMTLRYVDGLVFYASTMPYKPAIVLELALFSLALLCTLICACMSWREAWVAAIVSLSLACRCAQLYVPLVATFYIRHFLDLLLLYALVSMQRHRLRSDKRQFEKIIATHNNGTRAQALLRPSAPPAETDTSTGSGDLVRSPLLVGTSS